jgi:hypothetical protein
LTPEDAYGCAADIAAVETKPDAIDHLGYAGLA